MQKARILGGLAAGIVLLLCAVLLAVWLLVNPDNFKGMIVAAVKESTGRDLQLSGDIKLSVFPNVALGVGPARLRNPSGYGDGPFLSLTHASLRVRLLPLLRRRLDVSRIDIDGLDLRLRKNAEGKGNWQDAAPRPESSAHAVETGRGRSLDSVPEVHIRGGRVSYQDIVVENFNLQSAAAVRDIPMSITFDAHRSVPDEKLTVNAKFDLSGESEAPAIRLAAVNLSGTLSRPGEDHPAQWTLSAPSLVVDPSQRSAQAAAFTLGCANAHLTGSVTATRIFDELRMSGSLTLAPLGLHEFIPRLGMETPGTRDPKAWSQLSGNADFAYVSKVWSLVNLHARLDDTELQGTIQFSTADPETLSFDLAADQIDLDRYRAPKGSAASRDNKIAAQSSDKVKKTIEADGTLAAARMSFAGMDFTDLRLTVSSKGSVTRVHPIEAQIDGGRYAGDITVDERGAVRIISIDEHLANVDMARLLAKSAQKGRLSGRVTLNVKGNARGGSMDELLKSFTGHLDADLSDGAMEGVDLDYERDLAQAMIDRTAPSRVDTKRTPFDAFKTSAQITNGIAETHDLTMSTPALRVLGKGSANLSTKAIDFQLLASILKAPNKTLADVPLKVTGTYADPAVKPDINSLAKDQLKQKLQDILKKNGLQGLFGK